ncbi:MAG: tRNA (guanosine(37)-N1)-methyltransferase TrmD [Bacteroidales bacterium]|nr:tRNA (guanosine(37)-N1)-methyltransferase TrmD [Bacteroidales bacterium]
MHIDILTIFPEMFHGVFSQSIIKRSREKDLVTIRMIDIRDFATNKHKRVDDYQYGGGAGMVMMIEPISACIEHLQKEKTYDDIIFMTPDGELFDQQAANRHSLQNNIMILCGHYKGIDERIREHYITKEISVGDYVLSGGEVAAMAFTDAVVRLIPGVLNDETSALSDSFQDGMLSAPVYTRPSEFRGMRVPDVLLSGNDKEIENWRLQKAIERTHERRPGLMDKE